MGVFDNEVILDWTPREYMAKLKGAQHRAIDVYENLAIGAIMNAKASNEKRVSAKKLFNAGKARRQLDAGPDHVYEEARKSVELTKAFQGWTPEFKPKGGTR